MRPLVFLDVDGVLNTAHDPGPWPWVLNPRCIGALNRLTDAAQADLVLSSAWRAEPTAIPRLKAAGVRAPFIGQTAENPRPRGVQIRDWLDAHPDRTRFVIVDDTDDLLSALFGSAFFQTEWLGLGLTQTIAQQARGFLQRGVPRGLLASRMP